MGALLPNYFATFLHGKEVTVWMMSCGALVSRPESYTQLAAEVQWQVAALVLTGEAESTYSFCHNPFPRLSPIYSPIFRPHHHHLTDTFQNFPNLIGPNHIHLDPVGIIPSHPKPLSEPQSVRPPIASGM